MIARGILQWTARTLNRALRGSMGVELRRVSTSQSLAFDGALKRLARPLREVRTVIDVGASDGRWSKIAMRAVPDAHYLLIEANDVHTRALAEFAAAHSKVRFSITAAADKDGTVYFDGSDPLGGMASHEPSRFDRAVEARTVDGLVRAHGLSGPFLLKLDTHGFEVPILDGASEVVKRASLVIIEAYNFRIERNALRFHELCAFMEQRGFSVLDISDVLHRRIDQALWQFDLYFVPSTSPEFAHTTYELEPDASPSTTAQAARRG